jgi:hypothetical protein
MSRLTWTVAGSRFYEAGVDRGVLFVGSAAGVPWIGLISVDESPSGGEPKPYYIDGRKYLNLSTIEEFEATIKAYTYPVEFSACDGTARIRPGLFFGQQKRTEFAFSYRTMVGNETDGANHAYKIHLIYNALATPSSRSASTFGDSAEASDFSWAMTTRPREVSGVMPTAHIVVDSRYTHPITLAAIEDMLYGTDAVVSRMPTPDDLITLFDNPIVFVVTNNGGGKYFVGGQDSVVTDIGMDEFTITHPGVVSVGTDTFTITS